MTRGNQAGNRLQYLLGLDGSTGGTNSSSTPLTADGLRQQLIGNYTSWQPTSNADQQNSDPNLNGTALQYGSQQVIDENGLNAEINAQLKQQQDAANGAAQNDPAYGSLMRKATLSDLTSDPTYQNGLQFGLDQGTQGLNRQAAANGSLNSGATLKALTRFGNDYATTKTADAANRYTANQQQQYNMLAGVSGTGQVANAQVDSAGTNAANNISNNQVGVGNSRAASALSSANGITSAVNSGVNYYQGNQLLNSLNNGNSNSGGVNTGYGSGSNYSGGTNDATYWQ
ncbi:MAG: hypothetical protein ACXWJZ_01250 [Burkholderiaceae bacterium]